MIDIKETLHFIELEILSHLKEFPSNNTFTDIFKSKDYAKSHVSTAIANLVDSGYISKENSSSNKKVFNLILLEKSFPIINEYHECIKNFHKTSIMNISKDELKIFEQVLMKISNNLSEKEYE